MRRTLKPLSFLILSLTLVFAGCQEQQKPEEGGGGTGSGEIDLENAKKHVISYELAEQYIKSFDEGKKELEGQVRDSNFLKEKFYFPYAELFNKDAIEVLMRVKGAEGIRIYYGRDESGHVKMVLFPTDANHNDIRTELVPETTAKTADTDQQSFSKATRAQAIEVGNPCPELCDSTFQH